MSAVSGQTQTFTVTIPGQTVGATISYAVKFAYAAGGQIVTKYISYVVGNNCVTDTSAPTNFTATLGTVTANSVQLLFNGTDDSGSLSYSITYGSTTVTTTGTSGTQKSYVITGLTQNTPYSFSITAKDAANNVAANAPLTVTATTSVDPPPTNFTATLGTVTASSVQLLLNGTDDSGTLTYTVTYGSTTVTTTGTSGVQKAFVISNLSQNTAYSFSITAKDGSNNLAANGPLTVTATTLVDTSNACSGTSSIAAEGTFSAGYSYNFTSSGGSVTATFTLQDTDKSGVVAYLWIQTPFSETPMTNTSGLTFTKTVTGLTVGSTISLGCKFAYAGGLVRTKYFTYTVGDTCGVTPADTQAPTGFTATLGTVTMNTVQLLLNATDNSGAVTYTITYGSTTTTVTGNSGVQQAKVISGLSPSTAYSFSITAKDASGNTAANSPIVVNATTSVDTSTACAGTSTIAAEGTFSTGYNYSFTTSGGNVTATFTMLDTDKSGVIAYLWIQSPFSETPMTNTSGLTFTKTLTGQTVGTTISIGCKFAYAGGLVRTKYFTYTVGDSCGVVVPDTQAPTAFTATLGSVTSSTVQLLLKATDDSGAVTYTITYGATTTTVTGNSNVQVSKVILNLTPETAYNFSVTAKDATGNTAANGPIVVPATTAIDTNTMCAGTSYQAAEGTFSTGYNYSFQSSGSSVIVTFTLLDTDKSSVNAYLWTQTPFSEATMTNTSGLTFTKTVTNQTAGAVINFSVKFAYAGGLVRTKYFSYTVGDNCNGLVNDTEIPGNFTATLGAVTATSAELLLNGTDNSGTVTYTITYGSTTTTVTGATGVQQSKIITGLIPQHTYNFSVAATDTAGNAAANNSIVVPATTAAFVNTACMGYSSSAAEGTFSTGYSYSFTSSGNTVTATFTLLDTDKSGVIAYLWRQTPYSETPMTNISGLTFTKTLTGITPGTPISLAVKFAYAGGLSRTVYFSYTAGDQCDGNPVIDTDIPTNFTATLGTVTTNSVQILVNGSDNSGTVIYDITYGGNTVTVTGNSGVQQSVVITNGIVPATAYTFTVSARDASNNHPTNNNIVLQATTLPNISTPCLGISTQAAEGTFSTGYTYKFITNGTNVTATFTLLDSDKTNVVAYLWRQTPYSEMSMTNTTGLTFTKTVTGLTPGMTVNFCVKFAYAGGLSRTKYFSYIVGDTCAGGVGDMFTTTWTGSSWSNGIPVSNQYNAVVEGNYNSDTNGEIVAASLAVNSGDMVISSGDNFTIKGAVTVDTEATFTVENNANLIQSDDVDNTGVISVIKESAPMYRLDYAMWSSPVAAQTLKAFSPETLNNRFYHYNPFTDAYATVTDPVNTVFGEGEGYLIRVANTHPAFVNAETPGTPWEGTFTGVPNNGNVSVAVVPFDDEEGTENDVNGYNSVGNPYPSPINIAAFFAANQNNLASNTPIYFWRKKNDAATSCYASLTLAGYNQNAGNAWGDSSNGVFNNPNNSANWVINPGQGFIVKAVSNTVVFNNAMRVPVNNGQIFRSAMDEEVTKSRLWLNLTNAAGAFGQTTIAYTPATTLGLDFGWDGEAITDGEISIYSLAGESKLGIQARPSFDAADVVPLEYKITNAGNYTVSIDHVDGVFAAEQDIYLRDNLLGGITHNLKQGPYEFTAEAGTIAGRFDVVYAEALSTNLPSFDANSIVAYKQGNVININTGNTDMKSVSVYDVQGRLLYSANDVNAASTAITGLQSAQQMLIVQVQTVQGAKASRKIVF
ncbi:hypothetical protein HYN59_11315 [Flavobacterium album]|uniref:Fibronectin type-III domain-containing protein n=2 Tax=Flavobacterium album TaxID=2175091 RepID=A0A2S1QZA4_9FLAO|nr:hypothetical protein HYN59_11315 [Flavobacterium album]